MRRLRPAFIALIIILLAALAHAGSPSDAELTRLREEYALRFFDPEAHVALARALHDRGHRLTAFSILETARTGWFGDEKFDVAFARAFRRDAFDNSAEAEVELRMAAAASNDKETIDKLADVYLSRGDWDSARTWLRKAIAIDPTDAARVQALAEVERRDERTEEATTLLAEFREKYPQHSWSMLMRAVELRDKDPGTAMATINEALKSDPQSAPLRRARASLLQDSGQNDLAAAEFEEAARLDPKDAQIQGWTGRFFLKVMKDEDKALEYYLNAYFLDPHFYDSEHAEYRVKKLAPEAAMRALRGAAAGKERLDLRQGDPWAATLALLHVSSPWKAESQPEVVTFLRHDDPIVRWTAQEVLAEHGGPELDAELERLLADTDARVRGLALYLAVKRWGRRGVSLAVSALKSPHELVRYDALSALLMHGGNEGKEAVEAYRASGKEPSAAMKERMEAAGNGEPKEPE